MKRFAGFTIVELLVVIVIIGVLLAILLPAIQAIRASARLASCTNNQRQLVLAAINYESVRGVFPRGVKIPAGPTSFTEEEMFGWSVDLLPNLEQEPLHDQLVMGGDTIVDRLQSDSDGEIKSALLTRPPVFVCPSDSELPETNLRRTGGSLIPALAATSYVAANNVGVCHALRNAMTRQAPNGTFHGIGAESLDAFADGTSHTILISERIYGAHRSDQNVAAAATLYGCRGIGNPSLYESPGIQDFTFAAAGGVNQFENTQYPELARHGVSSGHAGVVVVGVADGSIKAMSDDVDSFYLRNNTLDRPSQKSDYGVWERMIDLDDGQTVTIE